MKTLIVIPARYNSTRLPGKPLIAVNGIPILKRTIHKAKIAKTHAPKFHELDFLVATDDKRIYSSCKDWDAPVIMTSRTCASGSDRVFEAYINSGLKAELLINLQADAPFTPANYIIEIIQTAEHTPQADIITPVIPLEWKALKTLRSHKNSSEPNARFSGTTCVTDRKGKALWFSKAILPLIRNEKALEAQGGPSPVLRHVGLYGFKPEALADFVKTEPSPYEELEGLEQLRALEISLYIQTLKVNPPKLAMSGIDNESDLKIAEDLIARFGDDYKPE